MEKETKTITFTPGIYGTHKHGVYFIGKGEILENAFFFEEELVIFIKKYIESGYKVVVKAN